MENRGENQTERAGDQLTDSIRNKVPEQHVKQFDELLAEARSTYRIREERGAMGDALSTGLTRRAILEAGRRLQEKGKVHAADESVDATLEEIATLLRGGVSPTADEIRARVEFRLNQDLTKVPQQLGTKPVAPPPADWYPKSGRRAFKAFLVVFNLMFKNGEDSSEEGVIRGVPVSPGTYEGTARLIEDMFDMEKIEDGDILVTRATAPSYNIIFPMIGAVVTRVAGDPRRGHRDRAGRRLLASD
jgi:pyruvate,water dikinase